MTATDIAVNMRTAALDGYDSGLCIVRVKANGDKRPEAVTGWGVLDRVTGERGAGWKRMQTERPPREMVERWFTDGHPGIGFVCGAVSGDLEVLEFEGLAVEEGVLDRFIDAITGAGLGHLIGRIRSGYYERSPSGGIHLPYRIEGGQVPGNTKLAGRLATEDELAARPGDRIKGWIETRGQGGFVVCAPSHGPVHKSGRPYELLDGGFATIATISRDERDALIGVCRSLDKVPKDVKPVPPAATASARSTFTTFATRAVGDSWMDAVVDHLTSDTTLLALVERYGWKYDSEASGYTYVTRPGKDDGISGFINGSDRLGVHSSSTPFESNTGTTKCPTFDRLDVIAVYEYGGDRVAAARHIAEQTGIMTAWKASRVTAAPADTCPPSVDPETGEIVDSDDVGVAFDGYRLTESGNASRLIDIANGRLRYVHKWGRWIVYRGGRWDIDAGDALVTEQAKKVAKKLLAQAATMADSDERKRLFTWALKSESSGAVASMIRLARGDHRVLTQHDDLDADPYLLNVRNGTIDLRSGTLRPHNPGDLLTMQAPVKFDAMAKAPLWLACIERWQPDAAIREYLQREMGAGATGHPTETRSSL